MSGKLELTHNVRARPQHFGMSLSRAFSRAAAHCIMPGGSGENKTETVPYKGGCLNNDYLLALGLVLASGTRMIVLVLALLMTGAGLFNRMNDVRFPRARRVLLATLALASMPTIIVGGTFHNRPVLLLLLAEWASVTLMLCVIVPWTIRYRARHGG